MSDVTICRSRFVVAVLLAAVQTAYGGTTQRCKFPQEWKGRWHQDGLGEVVFKTYSMSRGGQRTLCSDHRRDYFLVEDRSQQCFQCLLLMPRHENLMQYKQSFCEPKRSLQHICNRITVEAILFTLVRDPHIPTPCPFTKAYYFKYSDGMNPYCQTALSFAEPCAGATKYKFSFQHCHEEAMFNGQDDDLECIATWKDGSDLYLYGKFGSTDLGFRCFMYHSYGLSVYLSMSADATCYGLRSHEDGPYTMQLTQDEFGWSSHSCEFADWFTSSQWRDLTGQYTIRSEQDGGVILMEYKKRKDSRPFIKSELRCTEVMNNNKTLMLAASFTTNNCLSKQQCVLLRWLGHDLVQMQLGHLQQEVERCSVNSNDYDDYHFLYHANAVDHVDCPFIGRYSVTSSSLQCNHGYVDIGCNQTHVININCDDDDGFTYDCVQSWQENQVTYILARDTEDERSVYCLEMSLSPDGSMSLSTRNGCQQILSRSTSEPFQITLPAKPENCESDVNLDDSSGDNLRNPSINFQDASNAVAPPSNRAISTPNHNVPMVIFAITLHIYFWSYNHLR